MRVRTLLVLAVGTGLLGLALRTAVPVAPVDEPFRDVIRHYQSMERN